MLGRADKEGRSWLAPLPCLVLAFKLCLCLSSRWFSTQTSAGKAQQRFRKHLAVDRFLCHLPSIGQAQKILLFRENCWVKVSVGQMCRANSGSDFWIFWTPAPAVCPLPALDCLYMVLCLLVCFFPPFTCFQCFANLMQFISSDFFPISSIFFPRPCAQRCQNLGKKRGGCACGGIFICCQKTLA